jgi:regulator of PEP synthase PpsR (kinase-PPPase family)
MAAQIDDIFSQVRPVLYILSDSRGETAKAVVYAAAAQFSDDAVEIRRLSNIKDLETVSEYFDENFNPGDACAVFHTFADGTLRREIRRELDRRGIPSIDLLGPAVTVISTLTGEAPSHAVGAIYRKG